MNLFFWKKNKTIDIFATELANEFFSFVPPEVVTAYFRSQSKKKADKKNKKQNKKVEENLMSLARQIKQFRGTHSLGTYGKARLQLKFNERLQELGYDKDVLKQLSEYILVRTP